MNSHAIKKWWRSARQSGEPLKAFARRFARYRNGQPLTNTARWLSRKGSR